MFAASGKKQSGRGSGENSAAKMPSHPAPLQHNPVWNLMALQTEKTVRSVPAIQLKPTVGETDDPLEREADLIADRVMRMPDPAAREARGERVGTLTGAGLAIRRACPDCQEESQRRLPGDEGESVIQRTAMDVSADAGEEETIQPKASGGSGSAGATPASSSSSATDALSPGGGASPSFAGGVSDMNTSSGAETAANAVAGAGRPLSVGERSFFEPRFGCDFSSVRVHEGPGAGAAARTIGARAYTLGSNIAFAPSQYATSTDQGRRLMAHELAHVGQQKALRNRVIRRQEIETIYYFGGVPSVLDCDLDEVNADPGTSCCPDDARERIPALYNAARNYTDRAISRMEAGRHMDGAIQSHFGPGAVWRSAAILERIRIIREELDRADTHHLRCRAVAELMRREDVNDPERRQLYCRYGILASAAPEPDFRWLTVCINANGDIAGGWRTVLHEVVHLSGIGDLPSRQDATPAQEARGEYETYEFQREEGRYPGSYSLRNADSFAHFIAEVGAESWSEESVPAAAPLLSAEFLTSLPQAQLGVGGRATWVPVGGRHVQMLLGLQGFYLGDPLRGEPRPDDPMGFAGAEIGARFLIGHGTVIGMIDATAGAGAVFMGSDSESKAAVGFTGRVGAGLRFGTPSLAGSVQLNLMRVISLGREDLEPGQDWLLGLGAAIHWGGSSALPR